MSTTSVCDQIALYLGGALPFRSLHKDVSIPVDIITVCLCTVSRDYLFMQWNMRRVHSLSYCSLSSLLSSFISIWLQILYAKILQHFFYSMDPGQHGINIMTSSISNRKIFIHSSFLVMYVQYIINLYCIYYILSGGRNEGDSITGLHTPCQDSEMGFPVGPPKPSFQSLQEFGTFSPGETGHIQPVCSWLDSTVVREGFMYPQECKQGKLLTTSKGWDRGIEGDLLLRYPH